MARYFRVFHGWMVSEFGMCTRMWEDNGIFDDWFGGRIELFALALKVKGKRERGGCCFKVKTKNHPINPEGKIVENDHLTNGKVKLI